MCDSACSWLLLKILKYSEVMLNIFEFSHVKEIVESWLADVNKFWRKSVPASFSYLLKFLLEKDKV